MVTHRGAEGRGKHGNSLVDAVTTVAAHHRETIGLGMTHDLVPHIPILLTWFHCT